MRGIVVGLVLVGMAGCGGGSAPPSSPTSDEIEKRVKDEVAKAVAEERRRGEEGNRRMQTDDPATVKKPKEWSFEDALAEAVAQADAMKVEDREQLLARLTNEERGPVEYGLQTKTGESLQSTVSQAMLNAGFKQTLAKRYAAKAFDHPKYISAAKVVWQKSPEFRSPEMLMRSAIIFGGGIDDLIATDASRYFPQSDPSAGQVPARFRDFWESFSGTTWDRLK